jgi:hypothetical protein
VEPLEQVVHQERQEQVEHQAQAGHLEHQVLKDFLVGHTYGS